MVTNANAKHAILLEEADMALNRIRVRDNLRAVAN
jgi:hypothetical protein